VVALAKRFVVIRGGSSEGEVRFKANVAQCPRDHGVEILFALHVVTCAHGAVEGLEYFVTVTLFSGDEHANWSPPFGEEFFIGVRQITALVENRETHDVKVDVEVTNFSGFEKPPGRHPSPGAQRIYPEVNVIGHEGFLTLWRVLPTQ
jgi:hypothetical protein